jgi:large subunit ribosomal protein L25
MEYNLKVEERTASGKSANKKMRRQGVVPAVIYGHGDKAVNLSVNEHDFIKLLEKIKGRSPIIDLSIGDKPAVKAIIKTMQREAMTKKVMSVDFQLIHAKEKITLNIPVILKGSPIGVKDGGILDHQLRSIPIRCEVSKVPEHIEIDISNLKIGHSIHISDLKLESVEFMLATDAPIVSVLIPRKVVEEVAAPVAEELKEPEVITEKKREEETEPEEGDKKKKPTAEQSKEKEAKK